MLARFTGMSCELRPGTRSNTLRPKRKPFNIIFRTKMGESNEEIKIVIAKSWRKFR